ncbi:MAG: tetraacyldisaccharide 4'-kinase [Gammaproteobacteria bacterium]|jgi:tetraacyldisaccharide 4'-kinase|nr:tetraacyldisaccharide 4'-kinase [Chromatiales bacterium]MDP6675143.1 tetraacyldisaccharide 4'-kinase [Gammaproteobacteria bacterium]
MRSPVSINGRIERRVERLWYGTSWFAILLLPFTWVYRLVIAVRRTAYRAGGLRSTRCSAPVIVVGNITVGGSGKTPFVVWLVSYLAEAGMRPGIVSRGYGGSAGRNPVLVSTDSHAAMVGDEPLLLARRTGIPVCVCSDRVAAVQRLLKDTDINVVVADDGLQHYRLQRDLEIIIIDGQRGLGNGWMLPAGPLREPVARLAEADLVFSNGQAEGVQSFVFELVPGPVHALIGARERDLREFSGACVWAVAGIGNPERFYALLRSHGIDFEPVAVADHGIIDLERLTSRRDRPILMTEKDAVKYSAKSLTDVWWVPVEVHLPSAAEAAVGERIRAMEAAVSKQNNAESE